MVKMRKLLINKVNKAPVKEEGKKVQNKVKVTTKVLVFKKVMIKNLHLWILWIHWNKLFWNKKYEWVIN